MPKVTTGISASPAFLYDAVVLAGGRGTRMAGRDKGWVRWQGRPLIEHALQRLAQQTIAPAHITISANRNIDAYRSTGFVVLTDDRPDYLGPLAGVEVALLRCQHPVLMVLPCDMPIIPLNIVERLHAGFKTSPEASAVYCTTSDGAQPLCCLLKKSAARSLSTFLDNGHGKVTSWLNGLDAIPVYFEESAAFINFNDLNMLQATDTQQ